MRRVGTGGVTAALVLGLGAVVAAAGQPDGDSKSSSSSRGLLADLFGDKSKPKARADKPMPIEEKPSVDNTVESAAAEQQRQMNAVLRRMEVCDRLRVVALQTSNEELMRQADELEARAREVYQRQTAQLPMPAPALEAPLKTADKKPMSRELSRVSGARNKDLDDFSPTPPRRPASGLDRMGGDFESRERGILNGTSMGRDKP